MQEQSNEDKNKINNNLNLMNIKIDAINKVKNENINIEKEKNEIINKPELLNKPKELIDFDVLSHFKENISRTDKNDLDKITSNSYYCINCKHSNCPFNEEEKHLKMKRINYLLYDTHFFDEMDSYINEALNYMEINSMNLNLESLNNICSDKTSTNSKGEYSLNIHQTGQYMLLFQKEDYYFEKYIFTIEEITQGTLDMGTMQLIQLFDSGKIVVKLEWGLKPPDLDLICRFQVTQNYYCYTFFANNICGETEFFIDNRFPEQMSSEIIEISEFSNYLYLFYVRKYFDNSNGKTQNELKIAGVESDEKMNHTGKYLLYNEYLNNTSANIYIYSNGYKIPAIKINIPDFELNENNITNKEYIYWAAFCINGNEGINSLKVINQFMQDEPAKNICNSFYDENKLMAFR